MRTTLTLDSDVAANIKKLRKRTDKSLKSIVNEALRQGLKSLDSPPKQGARFRIKTHNPGRCKLDNIDNIGEVLALLEGENYK